MCGDSREGFAGHDVGVGVLGFSVQGPASRAVEHAQALLGVAWRNLWRRDCLPVMRLHCNPEPFRFKAVTQAALEASRELPAVQSSRVVGWVCTPTPTPGLHKFL